MHKYCVEIQKKLKRDNDLHDKRRIFHFTNGTDYAKLANSAFLMGAFMVVLLQMDAAQAYNKFKAYHSIIRPYRDASRGDCSYKCTILHCLEGLQKAVQSGWYDFKTFNVREYEYYAQYGHGDLSWIIPGKFLAFLGPVDYVGRSIFSK